MGIFFVGLLFVFFNFNLTNGDMTIDVLPNVIGYLLMYVGVSRLVKSDFPGTAFYAKAKLVMPAAILVSVVDTVLSLTGMGKAMNGILGSAVSLVNLILLLYALFQVVEGVRATERECQLGIPSERIKKWLTYVTCFSFLGGFAAIMALINQNYMSALLSVICGVLGVICEIAFLVKFYRAVKLMR